MRSERLVAAVGCNLQLFMPYCRVHSAGGRKMINRNRKPSCFISYCHDGADFDSIAEFENCLNRVADEEIEFLKDNRLRIGDKITEFEKSLNDVDSVIMILTPQYYNKIRSRTGGVYREYKKIIERLSQAEETRRKVSKKVALTAKQRIDEFVIIPILFAGTISESCPDELKEHLLGDFIQFRAHRDKNDKLYLPDKTLNKYEPFISQIVDRIHFSFVGSTQSFIATYEDLFNVLFFETKHELIAARLNERKQNEIYVKTRAYRQVRNQSAFILVGRKGSGKTTITRQIIIEQLTCH